MIVMARIKLAEAMGWEPSHTDTSRVWIGPDTKRGEYGDYFDFDDLPDPLTDANDDYAVLEWARENLSPRKFVKFSENIANLLIGLEKKKPFDALCISLTTEYKIGDYARAAVLVLDRQEQK